MKPVLQLVLVLGALIGLLGQGFALACVPAPAQATAAKAAMPDDCMSGMQAAAASHAGKPCKGMTLACIAAMGCAIPLVVPADHVFAAPGAQSVQVHGHDVPAQLAGRDFAPEPDPPFLS